LFDYLPLAALINDKILCVHSGIGENVKSLEDIANIQKPYNIYKNPVALDLLWAVPEESSVSETYTGNNITTSLRKRYFNEEMVTEFMKTNKINLIVRTHDVTDSGFEKIYGNKIISIFSATNYCGIYNNSGGILFVKKNFEIQPKILTSEENYSVWTYSDNLKDFPASPKRTFKK
jgi:protein phosphatase